MRAPLVLLTALLVSSVAHGGPDKGSEAEYPKDWRSWVKVKESRIPSADTPLPEGLPPLYVETIKMYNWVNDGKGTPLDIYVNPKVLAAYRTHGPYPDGITAVGHYRDANVVFVTQHLLGEAIYGTFDDNGRDIAAKHPSFSAGTCRRCHLGYAEVCVNGTCAVPTPPKKKTPAKP